MRNDVVTALDTKLSATLTKTEVTRAVADNLQSASFEVGDDIVYVSHTAQSRDKVIVECTDGSIITLTIEVK